MLGPDRYRPVVSIPIVVKRRDSERCTICSHPKVGEINAALDEPKRNVTFIASAFNVDRTSLYRHEKHKHLQDRAAVDTRIVVPPVSELTLPALVEKAGYAIQVNEELIEKTRKGGSATTLVSALRAYNGAIELAARLQGQLALSSVNLNIQGSGAANEIIGFVMRVLEDHPEALRALQTELTRAPALEGAVSEVVRIVKEI